VVAYEPGDRLPRLNLRAQHVRAPLLEKTADDVDLPARQNLA
jgi:hypothetical protein